MLANAGRRLGFSEATQPAQVVCLGAFFVAFAIVDRLLQAASNLGSNGADTPVLLTSALGSNWPVAVLIAVGGGALALGRRARLLCPWSELERGATLRLLATPLIALLLWQGVLYQYNYLVNRAHLFDRGLLLALGIAALVRPAFLILFVLQTRVIAEQLGLPFGTLASQNIDELLVLVLIAVSVAHLATVVLDRTDTSPVIILSAAAIATHFFIPGRGKVLLNWVAHEDLANLASSGYTVGWLGQTDGGFALWLADVIGTIDLPLKLLTLVLEVGVIVAVVHHRWFRVWLPMAFLFHVANFITLGFFFLPWMVLEVVLFAILSRGELRDWLDRTLSLGHAAITAVAVAVFGPLLFHPPGLAWLDTPVAYGYEIEVEGQSGRTYNLAIASFAPFDQDLAFNRLQLGETTRLTGAYGVVISPERLARLQELDGVEEVLVLEEQTGPEADEARRKAERFLTDFVAYANRRADGEIPVASVFAAVEPPLKYWTGRPTPNYDFQEPISTLRVQRVTNLRTVEAFERVETEVFTVEVG